MSRYQPKAVSLEGSAAFSDELSSSNLRAQERYQKGYSGDDPLKIQDSKRDDQADLTVQSSIDDFNTAMDDSQTSLEQAFDTFDPDPIPKVIENGDIDHDTTVDSLEDIVNALDNTSVFSVDVGSAVKPVVDVELDTGEKILIDEKIQAVIAKDPQTCASLESIILCGETNTQQIRQSVVFLIEQLKKS